MSPKVRRIIIAAGAIFAIFGLLIVGALYALQTNWVKNKVREKIVAAVEQVSGGHVEIGAFDYDWRTLTAEFRGFVIHGTEGSSAQPLFHADRVRVGIKIISVLKRNIDVASIAVSRPIFHLVIASDGSTNIPVPRLRRVTLTQGVKALIDLKVRHFEFDDGLFEADLQRIPLNISGENTSLLLTYISRARQYDVKLLSRELHVNSFKLQPISGALEAKARLQHDRLWIQNAAFRFGESIIKASGTLQNYVHPLIDYKLSADVEASDLTAITKVNDKARGRITLQGEGHYEEKTPFAFRGRVVGRDVAYRVKSFDFQKVAFEGDILARPQNLELTHLLIRGLGAALSGSMVLRDGRALQLDGTLIGLSVRTAANVFRRDVQWSGVASGPVHLRALLDRGWRDLTVQSTLAIEPTPGGAPLSGDLDVTYRGSGKILEFARSSLTLTNTRLSFAGILGLNFDLTLDSSNLGDLTPAVQLLDAGSTSITLPTLLRNGTAHFDGKVTGTGGLSQISGNLALTNFEAKGESWDRVQSALTASANSIQFSSLLVEQGHLHATGDGHVGLRNWAITKDSPLQIRGEFSGADLAKLAKQLSGLKLPPVRGMASGNIVLKGTLLSPLGTAQLNIANVDAYGERLNQLQFSAAFSGDAVQVTRGRLQAGPAELAFSGVYQRSANSWREGKLQAKIDSNGFPLASLAPLHDSEPGLNAQFEIHVRGAARISRDRIEPISADGTAAVRDVTVNGVPYGSISFSAGTRGESLTTSFAGNLRGSPVTGTAQVQLNTGNPAAGQIHLARIQLSTLTALIHPAQLSLPFEGVLQGGITFEGPLEQLAKMHGTISIETLELTPKPPPSLNVDTAPAELTFRNISPVVLQYSDGLAKVSNFQMNGKGSDVSVSGSIPLLQHRPMQLQVNGSLSLGLFELFDSNVRASGESVVAASVGGTLTNPTVNGRVEIKNGTLFGNNFPNGLTAVNGTLTFDGDRASIEKLTAQTGGGELSMGGFMTFGNGGPLVYRLEANAEHVRVRYGGSISITATSQLRLAGTSQNSVLSGTATVSRVIFNPNTDVGNLLASAGAPTPSPNNEKDFLTGLQFDIHVESAPNLQLNTELSHDLEAEIDLRLRGTPDRPILLGSITTNQGDIRAFGTKYTINRGEVNFVNPVRIEPVLDLDLQTQARGITVDITVSGTPGKLNINYRSDPPLQPRDIIALLTVGRAPNITSNVPDVSVTNDVSALQSGANTVLGAAISPASNRLSKLFGITNIKIDPLVQGITNTPQARLTVEQQISKQITVTYVTNLSQTSEQIFRLEWDFSSQYSLVALRDDNGEFGIDVQYRKQFK